MKTVRSVTAAVTAAAMLATSVTPAMAQSYPGGGYGYPGEGGYGRDRHHDHEGIGAGGIIAGIAVLGVIAAIASSSGSKNRNRSGGYDDRYQGGYRGGINSESAAADACANAIEQQGGYRVTAIDTVDRTGDGYRVRGTLNTRGGGSWGYGRNQQQGFYCAVRDGSVADVRLDNGYNGSRGY